MPSRILDPFARAYPSLARWADSYGWIEIGDNGTIDALVRVYDEGGTVPEGRERFASLDEALRAADRAVARWIRDELGE